MSDEVTSALSEGTIVSLLYYPGEIKFPGFADWTDMRFILLIDSKREARERVGHWKPAWKRVVSYQLGVSKEEFMQNHKPSFIEMLEQTGNENFPDKKEYSIPDLNILDSQTRRRRGRPKTRRGRTSSIYIPTKSFRHVGKRADTLTMEFRVKNYHCKDIFDGMVGGIGDYLQNLSIVDMAEGPYFGFYKR